MPFPLLYFSDELTKLVRIRPNIGKTFAYSLTLAAVLDGWVGLTFPLRIWMNNGFDRSRHISMAASFHTAVTEI